MFMYTVKTCTDNVHNMEGHGGLGDMDVALVFTIWRIFYMFGIFVGVILNRWLVISYLMFPEYAPKDLQMALMPCRECL